MDDIMKSSDDELNKDTNSYCIEYCDNQFFLGLADKGEDSVDVKAYLNFDGQFFYSFLQDVLKAIVRYQQATGKEFLKEFKKDVDKGE